MMTLRALCCLSALVGVTAHAQTCSGGAGGGIDATGNQCNSAQSDVYAVPSGRLIAHPALASVTPRLAHPTSSRGQPTAAAAPAPQAQAARLGANSHPVAARSPAHPGQTTKVATAAEAPCSGGTNGGTDATGNECSTTAVAGSMVVAVLPLH